MKSSCVLKILTVVISLVILTICFQFIWSTSLFSSVSPRIPESNQAAQRKGRGGFKEEHRVETATDVTPQKSTDVTDLNVMITFTNAKTNLDLQRKFKTTVSSMFKWVTVPLNIYIIGDKESQELAENIMKESSEKYQNHFKFVKLDITDLIERLNDVIKDLQPFFSSSINSYYGQSLFFLSVGIHRVMPESLHKAILLDSDLKFNQDIKELFKLFNSFTDSNVIGIARENQPVYRHILSSYRSSHRGTRAGDPPPNGITGFNSGVLLLDLDKMRKSELYNSMISKTIVENLTKKYSFKGHLGDQDFFSLISLENEDLFYVLPCTWNRQLCIWWKDKGYEDVFDSYFKCEGHINIYHGNGNTEIPILDWEK